jgi:hypothetical protein
VDARAGQRGGDARDGLDVGDDELAELVDVVRLRAHDHVVGAGHVLGEGDALHAADRVGDVAGLAVVGLDQDERLGGHGTPSLVGGRRVWGRARPT